MMTHTCTVMDDLAGIKRCDLGAASSHLLCGGTVFHVRASRTMPVASRSPYPNECDTFRPTPFTRHSPPRLNLSGLAVRTTEEL
jgi:hypothetical protein